MKPLTRTMLTVLANMAVFVACLLLAFKLLAALLPSLTFLHFAFASMAGSASLEAFAWYRNGPPRKLAIASLAIFGTWFVVTIAIATIFGLFADRFPWAEKLLFGLAGAGTLAGAFSGALRTTKGR
jgi:hypothetical protein